MVAEPQMNNFINHKETEVHKVYHMNSYVNFCDFVVQKIASVAGIFVALPP